LPAQALSLIHITPPSHPIPMPEGPWQALMFVSGNAVKHFFSAASGQPHRPWPGGRAWAPGPGTAQALINAGLSASQIDSPAPNAAQFDSESLWAQVQHQIQPGDRVLIVRGQDAPDDAEAAPLGAPEAQVRSPRRGLGREWLADRLIRAGAEVAQYIVYERHPPPENTILQALAQSAASDGSLWLFSSSEAIRHLCQWLPHTSWSRARAMVTHPRIGEVARQAGFGEVLNTRPTLEDVVASIESLP
jgi:uroporphyrinogen-III synthase